MRKLQMMTIYLGGFIGPFAGQSVAVIVPQLAHTFSISLEDAALTLSAYLFPFATVMLVSNRLVSRFRPRNVVLIAYCFTFSGALACICAQQWWQFLCGFVVMGIANAFTLPIFQVMLRHLVPPEQLGSAFGTYAAMQSLGLFSAPLIAGVSALVNWQLMYAIILAAAVWVLVVKTPDVPPPAESVSGESGRIAWTPLIFHMLSCLLIGFGIIGMSVLTALSVGDRFGSDSVERGVVIMMGGLTAFILSKPIGMIADKFGSKVVFLSSTFGAICALLIVPIAPAIWVVAVCWAFAIVAAQGMQMAVNLAVLRAPGGVNFLSTVQAFRFFGSSFTPVLLLPIFVLAPHWSFWIPAILLGGVFVLQAASPAWRTT